MDHTPLIDNRHIEMIDFDLKVSNNQLRGRQYNIDKKKNEQIISKQLGMTFNIRDYNDYYLKKSTNGSTTVLDEIGIKNNHVGTRNSLTTSKLEGSDLVSRTKCSQSIHANSYPFAISDEKIRCTTFTPNFCRILKTEMTRVATDKDYSLRGTKKIQREDIMKCMSISASVQPRIKIILDKLSEDHKKISTNDRKRLKSIGYDLSKKYFGPTVLWNDTLEDFGTSQSLVRSKNHIEDGYWGLSALEEIMHECEKFESFLKKEEILDKKIMGPQVISH